MQENVETVNTGNRKNVSYWSSIEQGRFSNRIDDLLGITYRAGLLEANSKR